MVDLTEYYNLLNKKSKILINMAKFVKKYNEKYKHQKHFEHNYLIHIFNNITPNIYNFDEYYNLKNEYIEIINQLKIK